MEEKSIEDKKLLKSASVWRRIFACCVYWLLLSYILNFLLAPGIFIIGSFLGISIFSMLSVESLKSSLFLMTPIQILSLLTALLLLLLIGLIFWHLYFIILEYKFQATIGKKVFGLKVVSLESDKLSYKQCLIREVFRSYSDVPLIFPGIVTMLMSKRGQRLGDILTETMVIKVNG